MRTAGHRFAVIAILLVVMGVALSVAAVRLGDDGVDPYATTPLAQAQRMADDKGLQVGLAYGGRMSTSDAELAASLDRATRLGATWVRTDLVWADVEREPGVYDWSVFDRWVDGAAARDLRLLPIVLGTPAWARRASCAEEPACPPGDVDDYAAFAGAAAARYAARGLHTWQLWNEPNSGLFWIDPDPAEYADLLAASATAIRAADPEARVVSGGLAALAPREDVVGARRFLRAVCARGVCDQLDVFAYHPYTFPDLASDPSYPDAPWNRIADSPPSLIRILDRFGLDDVPIWITEFGAPTGGDADYVTEERQAQIAFDAVASAVVTPRVEMLFWYTDIDLPERDGREAHFGLVRADGTEKPAWDELRRALTLLAR